MIGEGLAELSVGLAPPSAQLGFGGDAANVCTMASRLGVASRHGGRVGGDVFGAALLEFWRGNGVDVEQVVRDPEAPTGFYLNEPDAGAGHRFTYYRSDSAGSRLRPSDLGEEFFSGLAAFAVTGVTLAISENAAVTAETALRTAAERELVTVCILNHRPLLGGDPERLTAVARGCQLVIGSREDAEALFGVATATDLATALGPRVREVLFSDGARGAVAIVGGETHVQAAPKVAVANAAGAGDALAGAYLAARLTGKKPDAALRTGIAAASLSVAKPGCASSYPTAAEVAAARRTLPHPGRTG